MAHMNHKTLAIVSGIILVLIIGVNIVSAPNGGVQTQIEDTQNQTNISGDVEEKEIPQKRITNPSSIIDLSGDKLSDIPEIIFKRTNIEVLDLSNNNLRGALQAEIRHMSSLRVLDLSDNMYTGVPAEVGQLENLEVLDLSNNSITGLPYEIGNLKKLKTLYLRGNEYSVQDVEIIKSNLPETTEILTD